MRVETVGDSRLYLGDCIATMKTMADASIDAIVTDPPYELGFMGKTWDASGIAYSVEMWAEALRVLKPGGHLLAFSGSRTYHRMVVAIEDAGFDIRDQIMWIYGSGFPKSHNLTGDRQGWGTALKPAHEPICVARKPLIGTVVANVLAHGTGALNIDGCRVDSDGESFGGGAMASGKNAVYGRFEGYVQVPHKEGHTLGRWPANLIHDGSPEVVAAFPDTTSGNLNGNEYAGRGKKQNVAFGDYGGYEFIARAGDSGSAARFFYVAKASKEDREEGNTHPTVKPTDLMRYLVRMVTPPAGVVLDPFMGSGSTGKACVLEGFRFVGIDLHADHVGIAKRRIEQAGSQGQLFTPAVSAPVQESIL